MAKYDLAGINGNAYSIMGFVKRAMRREGCSEEEIEKYIQEAKSRDYDNLLSVSMDRLNN